MDAADIRKLATTLEGLSPPDILAALWRAFGSRVAASSSFQTQSVPLLHMIATTTPAMTVLFLDTGFHFSETLAFRDEIVQRLGLNLRVLTPAGGHGQFQRRHGELYRRDPDHCCFLNKVDPLLQAFADFDVWISGIRQDQTVERREASLVDKGLGGVVEVRPLLRWTERDVAAYLSRHGLPVHPLSTKGFSSIGCAPCTRAVSPGESARSGRWAGLSKTECGLHAPRAKQQG